MNQFKQVSKTTSDSKRQKYKNFLTDKKEREKRQAERQRNRDEEKVDIVSSMTGCSTTLAWIMLQENNMEISRTIQQIKRDQQN